MKPSVRHACTHQQDFRGNIVYRTCHSSQHAIERNRECVLAFVEGHPARTLVSAAGERIYRFLTGSPEYHKIHLVDTCQPPRAVDLKI